MSYEIEFESHGERQLGKLPKELISRIDTAMTALAKNPRPSGAVKLSGYVDAAFRIRIGNYRILYVVNDSKKRVRIIAISKRDKAYKKK